MRNSMILTVLVLVALSPPAWAAKTTLKIEVDEETYYEIHDRGFLLRSAVNFRKGVLKQTRTEKGQRRITTEQPFNVRTVFQNTGEYREIMIVTLEGTKAKIRLRSRDLTPRLSPPNELEPTPPSDPIEDFPVEPDGDSGVADLLGDELDETEAHDIEVNLSDARVRMRKGLVESLTIKGTELKSNLMEQVARVIQGRAGVYGEITKVSGRFSNRVCKIVEVFHEGDRTSHFKCTGSFKLNIQIQD